MDTSSNRGKRFIRLSFRLFSSKLGCTILFVIVASHNTSLSMPRMVRLQSLNELMNQHATSRDTLELTGVDMTNQLHHVIGQSSKSPRQDEIYKALGDLIDFDSNFESDEEQDSDQTIKLWSHQGSLVGRKRARRHQYGVKNLSRERAVAYQSRNNYGQCIEIEEKYTPSNSLRDALEIWSCLASIQQKQTTVLCVDLRTKHNHIKRFCFFSGESSIALSTQKKAENLKYDVIKTKGGHAELQLIQFLCDRSIKHPGYYEHIVAMGCSRLHCKRCDVMMRLFLGESYMSVTAATPASLPLESRRPYYQRLEEEFMSSNVIAAIEGVRTQRSILMGEEAISNEVTPHFYLNEAIRYFLKQRLQSEIKIDDDDTILSKKITSRTPRVSQETRRDDFDKMLAAADAQQLKAYKRSLEDAIQQLEEEDR